MHQLISNKLSSLENDKQVKILHAVESGSRAWGFASPDSDYDIRFIYKHSPEWYLSLWEKSDVIEFMTVEDLDGSGWDLAKSLKLLAKSNVPLIEWLYSPVEYQTNDDFLKQMRLFANDCFSPIASLHHYLGTTKNFMEICESEHVKLKSYFYALRTALAGKWIIQNNSFPPVAFAELLPIAPANIQEKILELQFIKAQQDEKYLHPKEEVITQFLQETILFNQEKSQSLSSGKKINQDLEDFFKAEIKK
ncbi:nucleotidyltransferase domain-containing protein [Flavobacterium cerinum]|uniref:Nucleotidyltransferase domain-containing protein n=1 Tax=Flavobacterium cerinum TaxID=2502784 RepID=A0A3S3QM62_9FLAO|nr:nucleotidyltransferase domain-containing protein [Flavobacterium cerinum]RWX02287.1 nucleotidyltransferase domain-containing protein [Flavobacterium cerinum]